MRESVVSPSDGPRYRFGVFDFDAGTLELRKNGRAIRVRPQSLRLLTLLVARPGDLLPRDDIQQALWGRDTFVDFEQGVNHCVRELRAALGDAAEAPRYIQTLPRRGYRFIAPVERVGIGPPEVVVSTTPVSSPAPASGPAEGPAAGGSPHTSSAASGSAVGTRRAWVAALGSAAVLTGIMMASYAAWSDGASTPRASTLVVRPFSAAQADSHLGVGLATAIAQRLGRQALVSVQPMTGGSSVSGGSSGSGPAPRVREHALVLEGEVSRSASTLAVQVRLLDASGAATWSDRFLADAGELFSVEDVIAERVVAALNLRLAATDQARLRQRYTNNAAAYEEYLRGRAALVEQTPDGTLEAIRAFRAALARDAGYALARAGLAMASADMYLRFSPTADVERWGATADAEVRAALDLDPELAEAHLARAAVARKREFDWKATMEASRRALVLDPNLDQARYFMAVAYYHLGYMEEALIEMEKGRALNGADVVEPLRIEALVALFSGTFGPARVHLEEVSRLSSRPIGDTYLALAYYYSGNIERARTLLESLARHTSTSTAARSGAALAGVLAAQGHPAAARAQVERVLAGDYRDHHVAYSLGVAYAQLGDTEEAVRWLRTAADTGFPCLIWFERDPLLELLRRGAAFPELRRYVQARRESSLSRVE